MAADESGPRARPTSGRAAGVTRATAGERLWGCPTPGTPTQYDRFAAERRQPFDDLVALCRPVPGGTVVDLGAAPGS